MFSFILSRFSFVLVILFSFTSCLTDGRSAREQEEKTLACEKTFDCPVTHVCEEQICVQSPGCLACTNRPNAVTECFHGTCYTAFCAYGWHDANGQWTDGCEYPCEHTNEGVEICDGIDNNCDGRIDETFDFLRDPEHCGGCHQGCPTYPNTISMCSLAQCRFVCEPGWYNTDGQLETGCNSQECEITNEGIEICDMIDNNCNGEVDEGIDKDQPDSCGPFCEVCGFDNASALCIDGVCRLGVCDPDCQNLDGEESTGCEYCCIPTNGGVEICDGLDNDCNGLVDDGLVCHCPSDMVIVDETYCIDRHEASRPDATAATAGVDSSYPTSRAGVRPWAGASLADAAAACLAAGKRLCTALEWETACKGPSRTVYSYGNTYHPTVCNGIDAYCYCHPGSTCQDADPCPFAHCYNVCGASFGPQVTGSFPQCTNGYGVMDINGNIWERVEGGAGRGGAFNCLNSENLHRCDYVANWGSQAFSNFGFRCCCTDCPE